jgi:hypothetical protein
MFLGKGEEASWRGCGGSFDFKRRESRRWRWHRLQSLVRSPVPIFRATPMRAIAHRLIGDLLSEVTLPQKLAWFGAQSGEAAHCDS